MNMKKWVEEGKWKVFLPLIPILGFLAAYLSFLGSKDIWTDEAYMMQMLRETNGLQEAMLYAASDTHPPVYFMVLKAVTMVFGQNLVAAKMVSILSLIGTMLMGGWFIQKHKGVKASILYILFIGALPCSMQFSVEIRMYGLALFFLTGCGVAAFELVIAEQKRYWIMIVVFGVLASLTHYFSLAATALIFGLLFTTLLVSNRKELKYWFLSVLACVILYAWWLPYFYVQFTRVSGGFWIPEITWGTILEYIGWYFDTDMPYTAVMMGFVCLIAFVLLVRDTMKKKDKVNFFACACLLVWLLTILVGIGVSAAVRPIFLIKYSFPMIGLLGIAFAWGMDALHERVALVLMCFLLCLGIVDYQNSYVDEYESTLTDETLTYFDTNLGPHDQIAYNYTAFGFIYRFYFTEDQLIKVEDVDWSADYEGGSIYLLHTTWNAMPDMNVLQQYGWQQEYVGMYGIEHNYFKIYRYYK